MALLPLLLTVVVIATVKCSIQTNCRQEVNCRLPYCSCASYSSPLPIKDTPQIIFYGFDDALNIQMAKHYRKLFSSNRRNPNNCPISMSLYVQHAYTDYRLVREFYKKGMEIGVHSVTHTNIDTKEKLADEAEHQKSNLAQLGGVPKDEIVGWRSPNLKTAGDDQPSTLQKLGYTYDISLTYTVSKRGQKKPWPYTLDYGYPFNCQIRPCPKSTSRQNGFWEVPVVSLMDYKGAYPCAYVDGCYNSPTNEEDAFEYLWKNFEDNYETRTPLGFNMHAAWFERPQNLAAMDRFIQEMTKKDDVYIVSVEKMLEWMKRPTKLSELHTLTSWSCKSASKPRSTDIEISAAAGNSFPSPYPTYSQKRRTTQNQNFQDHIQSRVTFPWWDKKSTRSTERSETTYPRQSNIIFPWWSKKSTKRSWVSGNNREDKTTKTLPKQVSDKQCLWNWCKRETNSPHYDSKVTTSQQQQSRQSTRRSPQYVTRKSPQYKTSKSPIYWKIDRTNKQTTKTPEWRRPTSLPKSKTITFKPGSTSSPKNSIFAPNSAKYCIQEKNCKLPTCLCRSLSPPGGIPVGQVPQMVYFTFDGPLTQNSHSFYSKIFNNQRLNPNGCPISATFFVPKSGNFIPYLVSHMKNRLEIALQGDGHQSHLSSGGYDIFKELQYMLTKLPVRPISGWRSPSMKPYGEAQYQSLLDNQMLYDSTLTTKTASGDLPWPYTLDFGWKDGCPVRGCPWKRYPGLWEIPVKPLLDVKELYPCVYADGCMNNPWTEQDTYDYLMANFMKYYRGNRSPMSVSFRQNWFYHPVYRPNVRGLIRFIDQLLTMDDVYIVSIRQLIQWLQQPTPINKMKSFVPWQC